MSEDIYVGPGYRRLDPETDTLQPGDECRSKSSRSEWKRSHNAVSGQSFEKNCYYRRKFTTPATVSVTLELPATPEGFGPPVYGHGASEGDMYLSVGKWEPIHFPEDYPLIHAKPLPKPWTVPEILQRLLPGGAVAIDVDGLAFVWTRPPRLKHDASVCWTNDIDDASMFCLSWEEASAVYNNQLGPPPTLLDAPDGDWRKAIWKCSPNG